MDEAIRTLIESVENIAPHVWAVAVRQAQINAWLELFWFVLALVLSVGYVIVWRKGLRMYKASGEREFMDWDGCVPFMLIAVIFFAILVLMIPVSFTAAVRGFANPEFAAIELLLQLVS